MSQNYLSVGNDSLPWKQDEKTFTIDGFIYSYEHFELILDLHNDDHPPFTIFGIADMKGDYQSRIYGSDPYIETENILVCYTFDPPKYWKNIPFDEKQWLMDDHMKDEIKSFFGVDGEYVIWKKTNRETLAKFQMENTIEIRNVILKGQKVAINGEIFDGEMGDDQPLAINGGRDYRDPVPAMEEYDNQTLWMKEI